MKNNKTLSREFQLFRDIELLFQKLPKEDQRLFARYDRYIQRKAFEDGDNYRRRLCARDGVKCTIEVK